VLPHLGMLPKYGVVKSVRLLNLIRFGGQLV
jgi:hypothetical protein